MLSSAKHHTNLIRVSASNNNKTLQKVSSLSPSTPSSPSSSPSSSSSPSQDSEAQKRSLITMEEVWKDISLSSIHHLSRHSQHPQHNHEPRFRSHNHNPNSIFQEFLNRPMNQEPTPTSLTMGSSSSNGDSTTVTALFSSPLPPPATVLSLNSGAGFEFLDNQDPLVTPNSNLESHRHLSNVSSFNTPFEALVASTCFGKKRGQESTEASTPFKQREDKKCSFAIIDLKKTFLGFDSHMQAYTNELELEVAHLQAENAKLKRQQEQLKIAVANQQPKKKTLQRSSSTPF